MALNEEFSGPRSESLQEERRLSNNVAEERERASWEEWISSTSRHALNLINPISSSVCVRCGIAGRVPSICWFSLIHSCYYSFFFGSFLMHPTVSYIHAIRTMYIHPTVVYLFPCLLLIIFYEISFYFILFWFLFFRFRSLLVGSRNLIVLCGVIPLQFLISHFLFRVFIGRCLAREGLPSGFFFIPSFLVLCFERMVRRWTVLCVAYSPISEHMLLTRS